MKKTISLIAAVAENGVIGSRNALPWYLPADLRHFKEVTMGKPIIMGRKTHESIGRALPGRQNIIITHDKNYKVDGCHVVNSLEEALAIAAGHEVCIIGGATIYEQALPFANRLYLTRVHANIQGDVTFPDIVADEWHVTASEAHPADEKNPYPYTFITLNRLSI